MRRLLVPVLLIVPAAALVGTIAIDDQVSSAGGAPDAGRIVAEVVATGIPGAGAITQIGTFQQGGPLHDNVALIAGTTNPKQVLDRTRLFVASTSNFGAPLAIAEQPEGSILSIDVSGGRVDVPAEFAVSTTVAQPHPSAASGAVFLYTAQSPAFLNSVNLNTSAVTKDLPAVSLPLGISLNSGFGRPWFANVPDGTDGDGTITVIDPNGAPLKGAPSTVAGGVFAGTITNQPHPGQTTPQHGLSAGALATALLTKSPDPATNGRAVFLAALADGSIAQVHVQNGVDDLVPPGSFTAIAGISAASAESASPSVITRVGMLFNWVPSRTVFVSDPLADRILTFDLHDDGHLFVAQDLRYLKSPALHAPVDLAPATREVAARNFASNTTLGGGGDFYVLNRGNNSIVRMTQSGDVVAVRDVVPATQADLDLSGFRLNGIAVSEDSKTIWMTATVPGRQGVVLRMPAFGAGAVTTALFNQARDNLPTEQGADVFAHDLTIDERLGPLFNEQSCSGCHNTPGAGGMGEEAQTFVTRVARIQNGSFDPLTAHGGPIARQRSIADLGSACGIPTGVPPQANATSTRSAMTLRGTALIDDILTSQIQAAANDASVPIDVRGRVSLLPDGRVGRFGWKAQTATLVEFMGEAFRDEIGLTNPLAPRDLVEGCRASVVKPEVDASPLTALVAFLNTIDPPAPSSVCLASPGATLFAAAGCANCHKPSYTVPGSNNVLVARLYSDLLLHDMGAGLADGFEQGAATGSEFRTAPLWRVSDRVHFLHDGRAATIRDAILLHGGQASGAVAAFNALSDAERQALLAFLNCI
jgi:di-heme oxidoreductase (putative peroxidase)